MLAFAGNSILCRLALADRLIDPASFTTVRMASAALTLLLLISARGLASDAGKGRWLSAAALFGYAICFSYAYAHVDTATGALILFGAVQATMLAVSLARGERPFAKEWLGWGIAAGGFLWMLLPGADAPSTQGLVLMIMAGASWGLLLALRPRCAEPADRHYRQLPASARSRCGGGGMDLFFCRPFAARLRPGDALRRADQRSRLRALVCSAALPDGSAGGAGSAVGTGNRCPRRRRFCAGITIDARNRVRSADIGRHSGCSVRAAKLTRLM